MIYKIRDTGTDPLLSTSSVTVNNLTVAIDHLGNAEVQTKGPWNGHILELVNLLHDIATEHLELEKELNEQAD